MAKNILNFYFGEKKRSKKKYVDVFNKKLNNLKKIKKFDNNKYTNRKYDKYKNRIYEHFDTNIKINKAKKEFKMLKKIKLNKKNIKNDISFYEEDYVFNYLQNQPIVMIPQKVVSENIFNNIHNYKSVKSKNSRSRKHKQKHKKLSNILGMNEISLIDLILNNNKNKVVLSSFI